MYFAKVTWSNCIPELGQRHPVFEYCSRKIQDFLVLRLSGVVPQCESIRFEFVV